jgi:peptide/nickel transport system permease protein
LSEIALCAIPKQRWPKTLWVSTGVLSLCAVVAVFAPVLAPHDPTAFVSDGPFARPQPGIWLGSDYLGRDVLSRLITGAQLTLGMAVAATCLASFAGSTLGLLAAIYSGWIDALISRVVDVILSLPKIIVGLVVVAALGSSITVIVILAAVVYAAGVYRVARALGLDLVKLDFIRIARARGESTLWILFGEMLPHVVQPLAADFAIRMSFAILFVSSLSFIGLGVQPPLSDWGGLVRENLGGLAESSFVPIFPAIAIAATSIALNLLVDAMGDEHEQATVAR